SSWPQSVGSTHAVFFGVETDDQVLPSQCQIPPPSPHLNGAPRLAAQTSFAALPQTALNMRPRVGSDHARPSQCMMPSSPTAHASVGLDAQTALTRVVALVSEGDQALPSKWRIAPGYPTAQTSFRPVPETPKSAASVFVGSKPLTNEAHRVP